VTAQDPRGVSSADALLSRLEGVKRMGPGRWIARCPAHEDRRASLSVRALDDGRTLIHCFALCGPDEVLGALGMHWSALFPVDWAGRTLNKAPGIPASDILRGLELEALALFVIAGDMLERREIREQDYERLRLAVRRIGAARSACER
jgi:hypothetical protein